jgi:hypothetical protein
MDVRGQSWLGGVEGGDFNLTLCPNFWDSFLTRARFGLAPSRSTKCRHRPPLHARVRFNATLSQIRPPRLSDHLWLRIYITCRRQWIHSGHLDQRLHFRFVQPSVINMAAQIKQDLNRSGWETTDFPSTCENCLPENPYVQMLKEDWGAGTCYGIHFFSRS